MKFKHKLNERFTIDATYNDKRNTGIYDTYMSALTTARDALTGMMKKLDWDEDISDAVYYEVKDSIRQINNVIKLINGDLNIDADDDTKRRFGIIESQIKPETIEKHKQNAIKYVNRKIQQIKRITDNALAEIEEYSNQGYDVGGIAARALSELGDLDRLKYVIIHPTARNSTDYTELEKVYKECKDKLEQYLDGPIETYSYARYRKLIDEIGHDAARKQVFGDDD